MKFGIPYKNTFARKILSVFLLSSIVPIASLAFLSQEYVAESITKDTLESLRKDAKSYGLYTFERLSIIDRQLNNISQSIDDHVPQSVNDIFSDFETIKLISTSDFPKKTNVDKSKPSLKTFFNQNDELCIRIDKFHTSKSGASYILRGEFKAEYIWGTQETNIFTEAVCVFDNNDTLLFCSQDSILRSLSLNELEILLQNNQSTVFEGEKHNSYIVTNWELYLPTHFNALSWKFVILKNQNAVLSIINKHRSIIFPVALIFFFIIAYWLLHATDRLLHPLRLLSSATNKVSRGEFDVRLNVKSKDEFEGLSDAFNDMAKNLSAQFSKSKALSQLDQNALEVLDIHYTVKNSLRGILKTFKSEWVAISIKDARKTNLVSTHFFGEYTENQNGAEYMRFSHRINPTKFSSDDTIELDHYEYKQMFGSFGEKVCTDRNWIKKVVLNGETISYITVGGSEDTDLTTLEFTMLDELAERIAVIYTSYQQKNKLYKQAQFDGLTSLPNRNHMLEQLKKAWDNANENNLSIAILFIDLDHFKKVNDLSGHHVGNEVLKQVAERIKKCVSKKDTVARLSGDEFCVLINPAHNESQVQDVADKISTAFKEPYVVKDLSYFLGSSIGVAIGPDGCSTSEQLLERADLAMFTAKEQGRNQIVLYDDKIEKDRSLRLSLERDLHYALENEEISVLYQPKMNLTTGKLNSVEALTRWNRPNLGVVQTEYFISIAEDSGLIHDIGKYVLRRACADFVEWRNKGVEIESIAVNVSAHQLAAKNFPSIVESVIKESGILPSCLELEVTESAFIRDEGLLVNELNALHRLGAKISIDDFGKEYSSLSYLRKMPFDTLKIDREFIIDLETSEHDKQIINVIISIGHVLNKKIIAEGIETILQRDILRDMGCDLGQGYLFSRPISNEAFIEFAKKYIDAGQETEILVDYANQTSMWSP